MTNKNQTIINYIELHVEAAAKLCYENKHIAKAKKLEKIESFRTKLQKYFTPQYAEIHERVRSVIKELNKYVAVLQPHHWEL